MFFFSSSFPQAPSSRVEICFPLFSCPHLFLILLIQLQCLRTSGAFYSLPDSVLSTVVIRPTFTLFPTLFPGLPIFSPLFQEILPVSRCASTSSCHHWVSLHLPYLYQSITTWTCPSGSLSCEWWHLWLIPASCRSTVSTLMSFDNSLVLPEVVERLEWKIMILRTNWDSWDQKYL